MSEQTFQDGVLARTGSTAPAVRREGAIAIEALQPAGKRVLRVEEFLRGYPVRPGERFA